MNTDITVYRYRGDAISIEPELKLIRDDLVAECDAIGEVTTVEERAVAVRIQAQADLFLKRIEKERRAAKEKPMRVCKSVDALAADLVGDLKESVTAVSRSLGNYEALVRARAVAEAQAKAKELADIERQRAEAVAAAQTVEQMDEARERFDVLVRDAQPAPAPAQERGQVVKSDWEVEVFDIQLLARAHPSCVKMEPLLGVIKSLLNAGVTIAGVRGNKVTKSTIRQQQEIMV